MIPFAVVIGFTSLLGGDTGTVLGVASIIVTGIATVVTTIWTSANAKAIEKVKSDSARDLAAQKTESDKVIASLKSQHEARIVKLETDLKAITEQSVASHALVAELKAIIAGLEAKVVKLEATIAELRAGGAVTAREKPPDDGGLIGRGATAVVTAIGDLKEAIEVVPPKVVAELKKDTDANK